MGDNKTSHLLLIDWLESLIGSSWWGGVAMNSRTSKSSYFTLFSNSTHKTKFGIANRWGWL
jgi:hypothetical protein